MAGYLVVIRCCDIAAAKMSILTSVPPLGLVSGFGAETSERASKLSLRFSPQPGFGASTCGAGVGDVSNASTGVGAVPNPITGFGAVLHSATALVQSRFQPQTSVQSRTQLRSLVQSLTQPRRSLLPAKQASIWPWRWVWCCPLAVGRVAPPMPAVVHCNRAEVALAAGSM
jgi:hypothetical protein